MKDLIIASNNSHKIKEIKEILKGLNLNIISLKEAGVNIDVEEDGKTFKENAYKKASEIKNFLINEGKEDFIVMADDSGLEIDYLHGEPGVYSARYAGEHGNDNKNNQLVLEKLKGVKDDKRKASFVCAIVAISSNGKDLNVEERCHGIIIEEIIGKGGFGYDPLFYVPEKGMTFAEMSSDEKNSISHRALALKMLQDNLQTLI